MRHYGRYYRWYSRWGWVYAFLPLLAGALLVLALSGPARASESHCAPVTTRHLTEITVTGLCPPRTRVELARPLVVVGWDGEIPIVRHDVPVDTDRARRGRVEFDGLSLGVQYEWRTIRGRHVSSWTIVSA